MGIEDKQIETIIEAHSDTVTALKTERDRYKEAAERVPDLQKQLEEAKADTSLTELQDRLKEEQAANQQALEAKDNEISTLQSKVSEVEAERDALAEKATETEQAHQEALAAKQQELDDAVAKANEERDAVNGELEALKADIAAKEERAAKAEAYEAQVLTKAGIAPSYIKDIMAVTRVDDLKLDDEGNVEGAEELVKAASEKWHNFILKEKSDPAVVETPPVRPAGMNTIEGAHEEALRIAEERHQRLYGKSEE
jgi:chromosome segregation ATPase